VSEFRWKRGVDWPLELTTSRRALSLSPSLVFFPLQSGTFREDTNEFIGYAREAARLANVEYVGHHEVMTQWWKQIGKERVLSFYPPKQWTHLTPSGAIYTAAAFMEGLDATKSTLLRYKIAGKPTQYRSAPCSGK
jgi:hypothetical protein